MQRLILALLCLLIISVSNSQEVPSIEFEYYSIEEIQKILEQEHAYVDDAYYGYWCRVPIDMACQIFPFLRHGFDASQLPEIPNVEEFVPFKSLVDLDKVQPYVEEYARKSITLNFFNQNYQYVDYSHLREISKSETLETRDDYVALQAQEEFRNSVHQVLSDYSDGFFLPRASFYLGWSNLKYTSEYTPVIYERAYYPADIYPKHYREDDKLNVTKEEAEALLGGSVTLVRVAHSIYTKRYDNSFEASEDTPDEFIWVNGSNAIGTYTKNLYQVVDEFGVSLNLLEDDIETQVNVKTISGIDLIDIQVMFDLEIIKN